MIETLTSTSSRKKVVLWLSKAQVKEKCGAEADAMMEVLPSRKRPKNPKVQQYADCDDNATMEISKGSTKAVKTTKRLDRDQVAGLTDSLNLTDDDFIEDAQNDFQNDSQAPEKMDVCLLPAHLKRAPKNKEPKDPDDPEAPEEPKKLGPLDKLSVFGEDEEDVAYAKAKKMGVMMGNVKLKLSQALEGSKKARYQPDPRLKKEAQDSQGPCCPEHRP